MDAGPRAVAQGCRPRGRETNPSAAGYLEDEVQLGDLIMGRNMFDGGPGPWGKDPWNGCWGDDPPFHLPVFVLTHHLRAALQCEGRTRFTFVTDGIASALEQAPRAAQGKDMALSGGAGAAQQYLAAGSIDELQIQLVPAFLGSGVRLSNDDHLTSVRQEQHQVVVAPRVTRLSYRVVG